MSVSEKMRKAGAEVLWSLADTEGDGPAFERAAEEMYLKMQAADDEENTLQIEAFGNAVEREISILRDRCIALEGENERLRAERDTPEVSDFAKAVQFEAWHQRARWGAEHDAGKTPFDWFWLVGYLAQKAASAAIDGSREKAMHHTISTAAALANWHLAISGTDTSMRPGIGKPGCTLETRKPCTADECDGCLASSAMGKTARATQLRDRDGGRGKGRLA